MLPFQLNSHLSQTFCCLSLCMCHWYHRQKFSSFLSFPIILCMSTVLTFLAHFIFVVCNFITQTIDQCQWVKIDVDCQSTQNSNFIRTIIIKNWTSQTLIDAKMINVLVFQFGTFYSRWFHVHSRNWCFVFISCWFSISIQINSTLM